MVIFIHYTLVGKRLSHATVAFQYSANTIRAAVAFTNAKDDFEPTIGEALALDRLNDGIKLSIFRQYELNKDAIQIDPNNSLMFCSLQYAREFLFQSLLGIVFEAHFAQAVVGNMNSMECLSPNFIASVFHDQVQKLCKMKCGDKVYATEVSFNVKGDTPVPSKNKIPGLPDLPPSHGRHGLPPATFKKKPDHLKIVK